MLKLYRVHRFSEFQVLLSKLYPPASSPNARGRTNCLLNLPISHSRNTPNGLRRWYPQMLRRSRLLQQLCSLVPLELLDIPLKKTQLRQRIDAKFQHSFNKRCHWPRIVAHPPPHTCMVQGDSWASPVIENLSVGPGASCWSPSELVFNWGTPMPFLWMNSCRWHATC